MEETKENGVSPSGNNKLKIFIRRYRESVFVR